MNAHPYADFIHRVQKPARYLGGELFQVVKDPADVDMTICLAFPDLYDIGMSHLGTKILYKVLNDNDRIACERAFTPWSDMEAELRERKLPVLSLESGRPLRDFDVLGFSLQYELTFTNVLNLLDLSGLALRAADRGEDDPLILGGGPTATHPEPVAPFFDAFLIGDAEERLPELLLAYKADRMAGHDKREALIRMAAGGGVYAPALYLTHIDERSELEVICGTVDPRVPAVVERAHVEDLNAFPFPDNSPVAAAQAIFDRLSVEIARGCTEGCRFCQAGMIYRPVRERDPNTIVDTIVAAIDKGGYDEASLTSLSTADYSCVDPLIRKVMDKLRERRVSLGVSSLRAYGLNDNILNEIRSVRATGLTFAPEAGTQRMRDIVNKNVTEEDIQTSAHRVFSKGWNRMKTYFMIGLPMEEDEDVEGIVVTTSKLNKIGRSYVGKRAEVTASVSSHVPKPHTPFQWAAMDTVDEIKRKQRILRDMGRRFRVTVKHHDPRVSYLEGIMARGDRRVAAAVETAFLRGCRFDGWDEHLKWDTWMEVLEETPDLDPGRYLGTLPVDGGLPWDHIDVGLGDGFLAQEWKRTTKGKLSPPCGKPAGDIVHHTNLKDSEADDRTLVCYHCGVACDLTQMREERHDYLRSLGALTTHEPEERYAMPVQEKGKKPKPPQRENAPRPEDMVRVRVTYAKTGLIRLQGHSDMLRILPRIMRRAKLPLGYSWGFNQKPLVSFSPATPLGTYSVAEMIDIGLTDSVPADEVLERLRAASEPGMLFLDARYLEAKEKNAAVGLDASDYLVSIPDRTPEQVMAAAFQAMKAPTLEMRIRRKNNDKIVDCRPAVLMVRLVTPAMWPELLGPAPEGPLLHIRIKLNIPAPRPRELVDHILDNPSDAGAVVRLGFQRTPVVAPAVAAASDAAVAP